MAIQSVNPATGEVVRTFEPHSPAQVEEKLARAARAFPEWRKTSFAERRRLLLRAADLLDERKDALARLMSLEMGKLLPAGRAEVEKCALCCRYYADHAEQHLAPIDIASDAERSYVAFEPLGAVLAVMPWNFPFWQVFRFAAPALMAGNVGLLKHASSVPQTALAIEQVFSDAGLPPGCFQTLLVGSKAIAALLQDDRIAAATLTGSEGAGRSLAENAGRALKKVVLELGGSDPYLILPSADLDQAATVAVTARVQNAGQSCIAAKRFIVHQDVYEDFTDRFVRRMAALTVGDPQDPQTQVGPMASIEGRDDLAEQVRRCVEKGARVLCGGGPLPGKGAYFAPTVLADAPKGSPAREEELFGPVAVLLKAASLDEAIALANETKFGLGSAAFTKDRAEQARLARELEAGCVFFNGMVKSDPRLPFGGVKASGYGRELSVFGIREFVNVKTIWVGA